MRRRETPRRRPMPHGKDVWQARWTDQSGKRRYGWPPEIKGTYALKRDAQAAIDACYEKEASAPANPNTLGGYFETWTTVHPRARITDMTNEGRIRQVLDVTVEGAPLRDWPFEMLRRRHANLLVDHMLRVQGRAHTGALNIIGSLRAMTEDAIDDEVALANPFRGVKVRANDPRIQKQRRAVRVFTWPKMHAFAAACARSEAGGLELQAWRKVHAEPMVRVLSDCGLRAGELLALERSDLDLKDGLLTIKQTTSLGEILPGTKTDHCELDAGRVVPVPPELLGMLRGMIQHGMKSRSLWDSPLLFPSPRGHLWFYTAWWRDVWQRGREESGMDARPHEFRHSWVSLMRAAGIDPADLADVGGHTVETATRRYTHGLGRSFDAIREAVGE